LILTHESVAQHLFNSVSPLKMWILFFIWRPSSLFPETFIIMSFRWSGLLSGHFDGVKRLRNLKDPTRFARDMDFFQEFIPMKRESR
jgi:hypothetical protein